MKITRSWSLWAFAVLIVFVAPVFAESVGNPVPLDPEVRTGKLANGLTYYIRRNAKPEKRVELRLAVDTGSVQEDDDQRGLAHLIEHMCFRGTKTFPKVELLHYLQSVGAGFGPDINAFTSFDETVYMLSLPSDKEDILANGLKIMRDWAHDVNFDDADIDVERKVVLEEWRIGRGANQRMMDKFFPIAFKGSKYAERNPIGTKEVIEGASYDTIKRFYHDWYRPDLMALVVVGDIDPDAIEKTVKTEFGAIPAATKPRPKDTAKIPDNANPIYAIVSDKENPYNILFLVFKSPVEFYRTEAEYQRYLTERLFIQIMNTRLSELVQQANPPVVYTGAEYGHIFSRGTNAYMLTALAPDNGVERGLKAVMTENERVGQHGLTAAELERGKKALLKSIEDRFHEKEKTESPKLVMQFVYHYLYKDPAPGVDFEYQFAKQHLPEITLADVNALSKKWITPANRIVIAENVEKQNVKVPAESELQAVIKDVAALKLDPYKENQLAASLLKQTPQPGKITAEKQIKEAGVTELTLSNGVRVVLKPSTFKNDEVMFSAYRPGGQSVFPDDYNLSAQMASSYVMEAGVGSFSKIDLQKMLAGKTVQIIPQISLYFDQFNASCSAADLETALQLTYLYFTAPRKDEQTFESFVSRQKTFLANYLSDPVNSFRNEYEDRRYSHHRRNPNIVPTDDDWRTLSLDKVMQVYQNRFGNASEFTFTFVGTFTLERVKPLLETYLGSLPSTGSKENWKDLGLRSVAGPVDEKIMRGNDPKSMMMISLDVPGKWSRDEGHILWSLGNILERRLIDRLREDMGGVYYASARAALEKVPFSHATLELQVPCSPDNTDKLMAAVTDEVRRLQKEAVNSADLQKELESQRRANQKDAEDNNAWRWKLELIYKNEESITRVTDPDEMVRLVTPENLQRVANQYLDTAKWVRYTLFPVAK